MTQEKFEQAKTMERRMESVGRLIELFSSYDYKLEPPTKTTDFTIWLGSQKTITLNEAEAALFLNALVDEKNKLQQEFDGL